MGVARTFQNIRLFGKLSVLDNVKVAMKCKTTYGFADAIFRTQKYRREEQMIEEKASELLELFHMEKISGLQAGNLPYGEQRKLEKMCIRDRPLDVRRRLWGLCLNARPVARERRRQAGTTPRLLRNLQRRTVSMRSPSTETRFLLR